MRYRFRAKWQPEPHRRQLHPGRRWAARLPREYPDGHPIPAADRQRQRGKYQRQPSVLFLWSSRYCLDNLAAVVVLPEPFTPTSNITAGLSLEKSNKGGGVSRFNNSARSARRSSLVLVNPLSLMCFWRVLMIDSVVSRPKSA